MFSLVFFLVFYGLDAGWSQRDLDDRIKIIMVKDLDDITIIMVFVFLFWFSMVSTPAGAGEISTTCQIVEIPLQL